MHKSHKLHKYLNFSCFWIYLVYFIEDTLYSTKKLLLFTYKILFSLTQFVSVKFKLKYPQFNATRLFTDNLTPIKGFPFTFQVFSKCRIGFQPQNSNWNGTEKCYFVFTTPSANDEWCEPHKIATIWRTTLLSLTFRCFLAMCSNSTPFGDHLIFFGDHFSLFYWPLTFFGDKVLIFWRFFSNLWRSFANNFVDLFQFLETGIFFLGIIFRFWRSFNKKKYHNLRILTLIKAKTS